MAMFLHPAVTDDYSVTAGHPDAEGLKKMLCDGYNFSPERVDRALEGFAVKAGAENARELVLKVTLNGRIREVMSRIYETM